MEYDSRLRVLSSFNSNKLREMWGEADDTAGETCGGFTKGEIYLEIARREERPLNNSVPEVIQAKFPDIVGQPVEQETHQPPLISDLEAPRKPGSLGVRKTPSGMKMYPTDLMADVINGTDWRND
jgi:hypothetical protein